MKKTNPVSYNRRGFLGLATPVCAVTCLALKGLPAAAGELRPLEQNAAPTGHPFDRELPRMPTYRQVFRWQYRNLAMLAGYLDRTLGREKTIELLEGHGAELSTIAAKRAVQRAGRNDFAALKKMFSPDYPPYANTLVFEVVESTDEVHELKVTECLWAKTWLETGSPEEGFAAICHGDYAFARAFNPNIEMVRDKTLMQGHPFCNHRYIWKG